MMPRDGMPAVLDAALVGGGVSALELGMLSGTLDAVEAAVGYRFSNRRLLAVALTHRSHGAMNNERLEFLGDGVLNCVIAELLYCQCADLPEGALSRARAALVKADALADIAQALSLGGYIRFGEGEVASGGAARPSLLADALEAVFGAILLDSGYLTCRSVISSLYGSRIADAIAGSGNKDHKTTLQEILQGQKLPLPAYTLESVSGLAHERVFVAKCEIPAFDLVTQGSAGSRRAAEQLAAQQALAALERGGLRNA